MNLSHFTFAHFPLNLDFSSAIKFAAKFSHFPVCIHTGRSTLNCRLHRKGLVIQAFPQNGGVASISHSVLQEGSHFLQSGMPPAVGPPLHRASNLSLSSSNNNRYAYNACMHTHTANTITIEAYIFKTLI